MKTWLHKSDSIGCLMGVLAVDASYGTVELMEPIRCFQDDWTAAFAKLYSGEYSQEEA